MAKSNELVVTGAFVEHLRKYGAYPLKAGGVSTLQMNITLRCNLACRHCHVAAGPGRTEMMSPEILKQCLRAAEHPSITTVDITGGAPEMHPNIEQLVRDASAMGKRVLVRSNLVILLDPEYRHLMDTFAANRVELVGSLPDYRARRTDSQRGSGVYDRTIEAMRQLNGLGYGAAGSGLVLDLMHNPAGAYLPGSQSALEAEYRRVLQQEHSVVFSSLFCLVNCPIGRYLKYLEDSENLDDYMHALRKAFNPQTISLLMCRQTVSVRWDGRLFDCDFNQFGDVPINDNVPQHIDQFEYDALAGRLIEVRDHCFACTAGSGSSCCGALINKDIES